MTLHMGHQTILCEIFSSEKSFMSRSYSLEPFMFGQLSLQLKIFNSRSTTQDKKATGSSDQRVV